MRITNFSVLLKEDKTPVLVKESGKNYPEINCLDCPQKIVEIMNLFYNANKKAEEYVWLIALTNRNTPIGFFEVSHGTVNMSSISPREIFIRLCLCGATNYVVVHNHPSGDSVPSETDITVTNKLKEVSDMMEICFLDHIIIGEGNFYSLRENNLLK